MPLVGAGLPVATPNEVLAWVVLGGLAVAAGIAIWRTTRPGAKVEVDRVERRGAGEDTLLAAWVRLRNEAKTALALETVEVTKVVAGGGGRASKDVVTVDVDDDIRIPVESGGELEGEVTFRWGGEDEPVPEEVRLRVLFVFRSPTGAQLAEAWVEG